MAIIETVGVVLGLVLIAYLLPAALVAGMVLKFSGTRSDSIVPDATTDVREFAHYGVWAASEGFEWLGAYRVLGVLTTAWLHRTESTYFCLYSMGANQFTDFATELGGQKDVTTSNSRGGLLFPNAPGVWKQVFPDMGLVERWQLHREAIEYLQKRFGVGYASDIKDFPESMAGAIRRETAYVRSLSFWPLRWPYWYFVRRRRLTNMTVREQIESGLAQ